MRALTELKPCPFCKKKVAKIWEDEGDFAVVCDWGKGGCGASGGYRVTEEEAVEAWNHRAKEKEPQALAR